MDRGAGGGVPGESGGKSAAAQGAEAGAPDGDRRRGGDLAGQIEIWRQELYRAAARGENLWAPGVQEVSETLDRLIVRLQRRHGGRRERRGHG